MLARPCFDTESHFVPHFVLRLSVEGSALSARQDEVRSRRRGEARSPTHNSNLRLATVGGRPTLSRRSADNGLRTVFAADCGLSTVDGFLEGRKGKGLIQKGTRTLPLGLGGNLLGRVRCPKSFLMAGAKVRPAELSRRLGPPWARNLPPDA